MKVTCDAIEYLPYSITASCHINKKVDFEIVKFKNLAITGGVFDDVIHVPGKSFIYQLGYPIYHSIIDRCAQFEILNEFDNEIKPYFLFRSDFRPAEKYVEDIVVSEENYRNYKTLYSKPRTLKEAYPITDYDIDLEALYRKSLNTYQENYYRLDIQNFVFEELYMIVDELHIIPEYVFEDLNVKKPIFLNEEKDNFAGNMGGTGVFPGDPTPIHKEFKYDYPDVLRYGMEKFRKRVRDNVEFKPNNYDKIYISRAIASFKIKDQYDLLMKSKQEAISEEFKSSEIMKNGENKQVLDGSIAQSILDRYTYRYYDKEPELEKFFESQGFTVIRLENTNYFDELNYFMNAKEVAALTGSSLVSSYICNKDTKIFEIMAPHPSMPNPQGCQIHHFYFSPVMGCIQDKGSDDSCQGERNWYHIGFPDGTDQLEKIKKDYLDIKEKSNSVK